MNVIWNVVQIITILFVSWSFSKKMTENIIIRKYYQGGFNTVTMKNIALASLFRTMSFFLTMSLLGLLNTSKFSIFILTASSYGLVYFMFKHFITKYSEEKWYIHPYISNILFVIMSEIVLNVVLKI